MRTLLLKSWRDLRARRWQAIGLALIVAAVVGATAGAGRATRMMEFTRDATYDELALADLEIRCSPTLPGVLERVRDVSGIADAEEQMLLEGSLRGEAGPALPAMVRVLGDVPPRINRLRLLAGRYPRQGEEGVILDRSLPDVLSVSVGDRVEVEIGGSRRMLTVLGISLSPDHLLYPVHPEYLVPIRGTFAVLAVSHAAAETFEHADLVDSLLFRLEGGVDPEALRIRLLDDLGISPIAAITRAEAPTDRAVGMIVRFFHIYVPAGLFVLITIATTLVVLSLRRVVESEARQIGVLEALGHAPAAIAGGYVTTPLLACLGGALLGAAGHGVYARFVFASYATGTGFAPLRDPGAGPELFTIVLSSLLVAGAVAFSLAWRTARRLPLCNLRLAPQNAHPFPLLGRALAAVRRVLPLPMSIRLGTTYLSRRRWVSGAAIVCLGLNLALVVSFIFVHVTHEEETTRGLQRLGLDAAVYFSRPMGDELIPPIEHKVGGEVQPMISVPLVVQYADSLAIQRVLGLEPSSWLRQMPVVRGRGLERPDAYELVVDQYVADERGLEVGDRLTLFPSYSAPEGTEFEVVGVLGGSSLGYAVMPLEAARAFLGLPGLSTSLCVASDMPTEELEARLRELPNVRSVQALDRARAGARLAFAGLERVLALAVAVSIVIAVLFLGLLAALDATDRAPDLALLQALGWRDPSLLGIGITEVLVRGSLAFLVAVPLAPLIASWLLRRLEEANGYRMDLQTPSWAYAVIGAACVLLVPLGALPAWRAARRGGAGATLRRLFHE